MAQSVTFDKINNLHVDITRVNGEPDATATVMYILSTSDDRFPTNRNFTALALTVSQQNLVNAIYNTALARAKTAEGIP